MKYIISTISKILQTRKKKVDKKTKVAPIEVTVILNITDVCESLKASKKVPENFRLTEFTPLDGGTDILKLVFKPPVKE